MTWPIVMQTVKAWHEQQLMSVEQKRGALPPSLFFPGVQLIVLARYLLGVPNP